MTIEGIFAHESVGGTGAPSGAPLPSVLAVLLVGGVGAGAFKFGKK